MKISRIFPALLFIAMAVTAFLLTVYQSPPDGPRILEALLTPHVEISSYYGIAVSFKDLTNCQYFQACPALNYSMFIATVFANIILDIKILWGIRNLIQGASRMIARRPSGERFVFIGLSQILCGFLIPAIVEVITYSPSCNLLS